MVQMMCFQLLPRLVFNATCSAVLAIIDIGQNASNSDPSIATNKPTSKLATLTEEDMSEVPSITSNKPTAKLANASDASTFEVYF
jgi:hypothetical protein